MSKDTRFWRNVTLIGLAHLVVVVGLVRWSRETKGSSAQSIFWMNGATGDGAVAGTKKAAPPKPVRAPTPAPEPKIPRTEEPEDEQPVLTSAKSDIQLPTPKPTPSATSTPKASPTPVVKVTPKPTP